MVVKDSLIYSKNVYFYVNREKEKAVKNGLLRVWDLLDSNQRPLACRASALNQLS
jgi:hypothetical protein